MNDGQLEGEELISTGSANLNPVHDINGAPNSEVSVSPDIGPRGQTLNACGAYDLKILMERYPSTITGYQINEDCMAHFNNYMDVFSVRNSDGSIGGGNGQSEFGGFHNDTTLTNLYGYTWDGALGVCFTYSADSSACSKIIESDVYYNPAYSYSDDPNVWFKNSSVYNLRAVAIHEIGHIWGYQLGVAEAYDYDHPSVMHAVYQSIYETGRGLHATDAYIFRRHYDDQTTIKNVSDVGIEAYYASNGLVKATINGSSFTRGGTMSFSKVTSENLGRSNAPVRVRFYLSDSHGFSGNYYQVGGDWSFGTTGLSPESFSTNDFAGNTIPSNVPAGTYYVLAYIDVPSGTDDFGSNNTAVFTDRVTITVPTIDRTPSQLSQSIITGQTASSQSFTIRNSGSGTLNYSISLSYSSASTGWLSLNTNSGTSTGETDTIIVSYNTAGLPAGNHSATLNISDPNASNSGQTVLVNMNVTAANSPVSDWDLY